MKKTTFNLKNINGSYPTTGYQVTLPPPFQHIPLVAHRANHDHKLWSVSDPKSGCRLHPKFHTTRKEAIEKAHQLLQKVGINHYNHTVNETIKQLKQTPS